MRTIWIQTLTHMIIRGIRWNTFVLKNVNIATCTKFMQEQKKSHLKKMWWTFEYSLYNRTSDNKLNDLRKENLTFLTRSTNVMSLSVPFCHQSVRNVNFKQFQTNQTLQAEIDSSSTSKIGVRSMRKKKCPPSNITALPYLLALSGEKGGGRLIRERQIGNFGRGDKYGLKIKSITESFELTK